jgi:hypothetical protein
MESSYLWSEYWRTGLTTTLMRLAHSRPIFQDFNGTEIVFLGVALRTYGPIGALMKWLQINTTHCSYIRIAIVACPHPTPLPAHACTERCGRVISTHVSYSESRVRISALRTIYLANCWPCHSSGG